MNKFFLLSIILRKINVNLLLINKLNNLQKKLYFIKIKKIFFNFNYIFLKNFLNDYNYSIINNKNKEKKFFLKIFNIQKNLKIDKIISSIKSYFIYNSLCIFEKIIIIFFNKIFKKIKFEEISIPLTINYSNLLYSGQIPKFYNNLFKIEKNKFLIPTSEVILNSLSFFIKKKFFPIKLYCNSLCFRKEIGNLNKKNSSFKRQNQFKKIEIFQYFLKNESFERFYENCSIIIFFLKIFKIKFKLIKISNFELNNNCFLSYDFEIWDIINLEWLEISSISLCLDKPFKKYLKKFQLFNINASCLPLGRLIYIIINNYRKSNNYIKIPKNINLILTELLKW
ncbi:aminoacyl--tRNA ligase-related protein [Candidatus Carsonella ruddii]|uniref:Seryl-tRNA(Ser/Sec) synthetase n=1 Tax=Candidatus Carsonella ruddii CE isolate Thao2000 TaxID=1202536 RepID=J7GYB5_CARRU|nr:aminoacyl--tRNA ligase-related protein [Candidatus Carsonella ruddii]AFP83568.1 seryl-tRNA synthetase [Candidatus Carsonella ruddii CE isolate Thao2000]